VNSPEAAPVAPTPVTAGAAPYWTSPQFKGLIVTFVLAVLKLVADLISHWLPQVSALLASITSAQLLTIVDDVTAAALAGGVLWALIQRARSKIQPLTLTKAGAAAAPETQAVILTQASMAKAGIPTAVQLQAQIKADPTIVPIIPTIHPLETPK